VLRLYYVPRTRAFRTRWLLEELGVPYQLARMDASKGETHTPDYLKINPLGHVPALDDDGTIIIESAAIAMHLADRFPDKGLAPAPGSPERARYYQWIVYAMVTVEPLVGLIAEEGRRPPEERSEKLLERSRARFREVAGVLEKHLGGRQFVVGDQFTAADVVVGSVLGFSRLAGLLDDFPTCAAYAKAMVGRPAAQKARED